MMEKVTQMIAMLIKAWKKESVSQIDLPFPQRPNRSSSPPTTPPA